MGADHALGLLDKMLWTSLIVAVPVVGVALVVGLLISVLQVATQLQEMTLSYIPKLLAATFMLIAVGPWMVRRITEFAIETIRTISSIQ